MRRLAFHRAARCYAQKTAQRLDVCADLWNFETFGGSAGWLSPLFVKNFLAFQLESRQRV